MNAEARLAAVREKIANACSQAGRAVSEVTLVGASKTKLWEELEDFANAGLIAFGENYVQEALEKQEKARKGFPQVQWHLIGRLQSNKAKFIPGNFSLFHALDSLSVARKLDQAADKAKVLQNCLIEVNLDVEASKGGLVEKDLPGFLEQLASLSHIRIVGLMCIPEPVRGRDPRRPFAWLREMLERVNQQGAYPQNLRELSMGMSGDFEAAILEGATYVRVGTSLFGARLPKANP